LKSTRLREFKYLKILVREFVFSDRTSPAAAAAAAVAVATPSVSY
jgi:protein-disulfide isomerase